MKFNQEEVKYKPITIMFEEKWEAAAFFSLVDKIAPQVNEKGKNVTLAPEEKKLLNELSDAITNIIVII